jgi:prolipoprotein diacylglyceryltransferase
MYPDFHFLFQEWFGIDLPVLSLLKTFGFLVAMAFLAAGYTLFLELRRKEKDGIIPYTIDEITIGEPPSIISYVSSALIFFGVGFKLVGLIQSHETASRDPLNYIFSTDGNLWAGLIAAAIAVGFTYFTASKIDRSQGITKKKVKTYPSLKVGDMAVLAAVTGFGGAKIFNTFEDWDKFLEDPFGSLFSSSGLAFYGGLIVATIAFYFYAKKYKIDFRYLCDAAAPGLILAYAIGRLGCQVAGDGDWGIYNSAFKLENQKVVAAKKGEFEKLVETSPQYFGRNVHNTGEVAHKSFYVSWLPVWFQAYTYPNNVAGESEGYRMPDCHGTYCSQLVAPVFPTPIYEFLAGCLIFIILWINRKRMKTPLTMFGIYLIFNGVERYFIEVIRVNAEYGSGFSQAELIAMSLVAGGIGLLIFRNKIDALISKKAVAEN